MKLIYLVVFLSFSFQAICKSDSEYWFHLMGDYHQKTQAFVAETQYRIEDNGAYSKTLFRGTFKREYLHLGMSYFNLSSSDYEVRPFMGTDFILKHWGHRFYLEERLFSNKSGVARFRYRTQYQLLKSLRFYQELFHEFNGTSLSEWRLGLGVHHHFDAVNVALTPSVFMFKKERPKNVLLLSLYKVF